MKSEAEADRDRRLEDHRAGDVAERQASLPSRTQKKLLTFSGSSVASGARISDEDERLDAEVARRS